MPWIEKRRNGFIVRRVKDGKTTSRYFATKEEAEDWRNHISNRFPTSEEILQRLRGGTPPKVARSPKLADYLSALIASHTNLRQGTREGYEATVRTHIRGTALAEQPVVSITPQDIRTFWATITPKTENRANGNGARRNVFQVLSKGFKQAINDDLISVSPLTRSGIKQPSKERAQDINPLTADEIESLAKATTSERDRLCILLAGYAGLRAGEVGGLRKQDIDVKGCRLSINQAVIRTHGSRTVGPLKTKASRRKITVACSLVEEVAAFMKANHPAPDGRIFYTPGHGMIDHLILNKVCQKAANKLGMKINFHLLRHTCASLLIDDGANPRALQTYMGHSDIRMTLQTYGHLFPNSDQALADSMQARREAAQKN